MSFEIDENIGIKLVKTKLMQWNHGRKQRITQANRLVWRKTYWNIDRK